jgi:hypothetical protein
MNDKTEWGWAVSRTIATSFVLAFLFLLASGASATIQQQIDNASPTPEHPIPIVEVQGPGPYYEHLDIYKPLILKGISNPVLDNAGPGLEIVNVTSPGVTIIGFTITGASGDGVPGILVNGSPDMIKPLVVYNNIYGNGVGVNHPKGVGLVNQLVDDPTDAVRNFWGPYGNHAEKGKPGAQGPSGHFNNEVDVTAVNFDPWITAEVTDGNVTNAFDQEAFCQLTNMLILNNTAAGVDIALSGGEIRYDPEPTSMGSALYNASPYAPVAVPGTVVKYIDAYVKNYQGPAGIASMDIYYNDVDISGIIEDTLTPYVLHGTKWVVANNVVVDNISQKVSGNFPVGLLDGSPIALVGGSYRVTILPKANPSTPISQKPVFTTFTIDSVNEIQAVYYQLDGHGSSGWQQIQGNINANTWSNPGWNISDSVWVNITNASHTFYFKFTSTGPAVGNNGEISWQFTKGGNKPTSQIVVTSPKAGDTLTRTPWKITWTMPNPENVLSVDLWFARDGDFNMNGGLNNPLHLATLGADTSYLWMSPNFQTDTAKIAVVVIYNDGTQLVGFSDDFSLAKGYSFHAYKPTPKTPWQIGTGISRAIAVLGSWFHKPHIPYVIR